MDAAPSHPGRLRFALLLTAMAACTIGAVSIWDYTVDDAWITFRYARNVAAGAGAVYNVGQRVEGFTSPLWLLFATMSTALGLPADTASKVVSLALALYMLERLSRFLRDRSWTAQLGLMLFATHAPLLAGLVCGLEAGANAAILILLLLSSHAPQPRGIAVALWAGLALLCRPENALIVGLHLAYRWLTARGLRTQTLRVAVSLIGLLAAMFAARWLYYGRLFPNTAVAKLALNLDSLQRASGYLFSWMARYGWLVLLALPAWVRRGDRKLLGDVATLIAGQLAFVLLAGGDWMPQWRFVLPVGMLVILACCMSFATMAELIAATSWRPTAGVNRWVVAAMVLIGVGVQLSILRVDRWRLSLYGREQAALDAGPVRYLGDHAGGESCIAARDIGLLGYRVDCRVLDLVGLTDPTIAAGSGFGRRERIDRDYVFGLRPDYLMLQSEKDDEGRPRPDRLARELVKDERFGMYRLAGRWELPNKQYCEIHERRDRAVTLAR